MKFRLFMIVVVAFILAVALGAQTTSPTASVQSQANGPADVAGILYASNFGHWTASPSDMGTRWNTPSQCYAASGGITFPMFSTTAPITIVDVGVPANTETVTPTNALYSGAGCSVSLPATHAHSNYYLQSGTLGLQEALNWVGSNYSVVEVTPDWVAMGGTTAMLTAATVGTHATVLDARTSTLVAYSGGSPITPSTTGTGNTVLATAPTISGATLTGTTAAATEKISVALTPSAAAGTGLGTAALPWGNIILGTAATNVATITPATMAAARAITLPDPLADDSVAYLGATQTLAAKTLASPTVTGLGSTTGYVNSTAQTVQLTGADWTCGTGGTTATCATATIIGANGGAYTGPPLTFTLPLSVKTWSFDCNLVVGQATAATANNWDFITATNGATNVTASYAMATAATAFAGGSTTDQASITTPVVIGAAWTLGGAGTKMPVHIFGTVEGSSVSGTVFSIELVAPTVADLVTIYRGSGCRIW